MLAAVLTLRQQRMQRVLFVLLVLNAAFLAQVAAQPLPVSVSSSGPGADNQQANTRIAPYLQQSDYDMFNSYPDGYAPLANISYRLYGPGAVPFTPDAAKAALDAFSVIYGRNGLHVKLDAQPSKSAPFVNNTALPDSVPTNGTDALAAYQSLDMLVNVYWTVNATAPRVGAIEATANQVEAQALARVGIDVTIFTLQYMIAPQAAPILSRVPYPSLGSYTVAVQFVGLGLVPFNVRRQTLAAAVFRQQLINSASAACMRVLEVSETSQPASSGGNSGLAAEQGVVNVTFVVGNKELDASTSLESALVVVFETLTFHTGLVQAGLDVDSVSLLSLAALPGDSITDMVDKYGGVIQPRPPARKPKQGMSTGALAGAIAGAVAFVAVVAAGVVMWRRHRRNRRSGEMCAGDRQPFAALDSQLLELKLGHPHASSDGDTQPSLTDFQKVAKQMGIKGMSAVAWHVDTPTSNNSTSSNDAIGTGSGSVMEDSAGQLTEHHAADFVHGSEITTADIEMCRRPDGSLWVLGQGGFGMVFRAVRSGVQDVAVKMLTRVDAHQLQQFRKEISILKRLSFDRNIVQFYGACFQEGKPMLVLEYMEGGDLRQAMSSPRSCELRWYNKGQLIALDVARGLHFLHSNKVMHSDLKTNNILLTKDYHCAKIGDIGLAQIMSSEYLTKAQLGGTFSYAAPELLLNQKCNEKVDIFSFGIILHELISDEAPRRGQLRELRVPEECPLAIAELIDKCLDINPEKRPSAKEAFYSIREAFVDGSEGVTLRSLGSLKTDGGTPRIADGPGAGAAYKPEEKSKEPLSAPSQPASSTLSAEFFARCLPSEASDAESSTAHGPAAALEASVLTKPIKLLVGEADTLVEGEPASPSKLRATRPAAERSST